ncbi:MAG: Acetyltransferase, GNAT family [Parcubacteria group bacterium GW2011_GWC2_39_14]|nr:MAG: Acetyltransferase, GNAT family [Parcubacteria group bacterium GW2011_GWC2_39_14]KKR54539.1 MAG: Acetyltransferase, GNAT family [Parcubacteria group bacterium GW2011_GWA2_40_23]
MKIRNFKPTDTIPVAFLISNTHKTFNYKEGTKDAVKKYAELYNPKKNLKKIKEKFSKSSIFLVAENNGTIVGVARGNEIKLVNLFVKGELHGKGIGKKLMEAYEKKAASIGSKKNKLNGSMYAVPFYQKIGYKKTTGIRNLHGLKVQPMKKVL